MATHTTHLNIVKPDETDFYDVEIENSNKDIIDEAVNFAENSKKVQDLDNAKVYRHYTKFENGHIVDVYEEVL